LRLFIKEGEKDKTFKAKLRLVAQPLIEPTDVSCFTFDESTRSITDYLCYSLNDQNLITEPNVIIPAYINEFPVLMIDSYAFYNKNLTSVVMQNNITTIGISAFEGNNLTSLTLSNSVTTIGSNAFLNNDLTNIVIPSSVTTIGENAFKNNNLTDVNILNGEINLAEFTFANNKINKLTVSEQLLPNLTMKSFVDNPICNETKYASLVMCQ